MDLENIMWSERSETHRTNTVTIPLAYLEQGNSETENRIEVTGGWVEGVYC